MRKIPLTQGKVAIVDDIDYDFLMQWKWLYNRKYAMRQRRESDGPGPSKIYMHNEIAKRAGLTSKLQVDHRDRDTLNNRRHNLRSVTASQQILNRGLSRNNTSGYKGVSFDRSRQKYAADIMVDGTRMRLGRFKNPEDAAHAYNKAASKLHGEFAYLNKV